jgi:cytochrome c-type biogenesis protein CcmH
MRFFLAALFLALSTFAFGQAEEVDRPDPVVEQRLKDLGEELRCLVCQNQTIADSNAPLALDLRNQIRTMVRAGRSDEEIKAYMVQRYGDFVLYRPPLKLTTVLLWAGPFVLVVLGAGVFVVILRRRRAQARPAAIAPKRRAELDALLRDEPKR